LAWIFMKLGIAQGEGQGVTTMRAQMKAAGNPPPTFTATDVSVTCVLRAHRAAAKVRGV
jgi:ATP-dependent DNA helicase RecG